MKKLIYSLSILFLMSCSDDDNGTIVLPTVTSATFTVSIENLATNNSNFASGTIDGLIQPGESTTFGFNAGKGHYLNFATMLVQSNDLFYAPESSTGIALYDTNGVALTGDITSMVSLWDAGTEVNETPGVGPNQAPRQTAANTGVDENGQVQLVASNGDGFTYPAVSDNISVTITHNGGTWFDVTIENISSSSSLTSPIAPGNWVINSGENSLFTDGQAASVGLERMSEDGNNMDLTSELAAVTGYSSPLAPGAYSIGTTNDLYTLGSSASTAFEALAEDGDNSGFTNGFAIPDGASAGGPLTPGNTYSFTFTGEEGQYLNFITMLVQSNDWVISGDLIDLFVDGVPISADITNSLELVDAGTEVDEYAGAGNNQPLRQTGANTGTDENGNVAIETNASANVPNINSLVKVTITAN
jgi:archaellum component FlaF (FlaF/FlaG flagellin family)